VFQACSVKPKKTEGCNRCQRCFNKVLSIGYEYLCKCYISVIYLYILLFIKTRFVVMGYCVKIDEENLFNQF
jgi:hypothetical protein